MSYAKLAASGWSNLPLLLHVAHGNDQPVPEETLGDATRAFNESVLAQLVALNAERQAEETRGLASRPRRSSRSRLV